MDYKKINMEIFDNYRRAYAHGSYAHVNDDNFVSYNDWPSHPWESAKHLFLDKLFENGPILTKNYIIKRPAKEFKGELGRLLRNHKDFMDLFFIKLHDAIDLGPNPDIFTEPFWTNFSSGGRVANIDQKYLENYMAYIVIKSNLLSIDQLYDNTIDLSYYDLLYYYFNPDHGRVTKVAFTVNGKTFVMQHGQKMIKFFGQLAKHLGLEEKFEVFRVAQSQLTNRRMIHGTINLSIHPMDYATASDNNNDWSSCMSWQHDGCYRMGTVEMMNSPYVVSAYIASNATEMQLDDNNTWPSKKWRAWLVITPEYIFVNRHYPYHDDDIAKAVLEWAKELIKEKIGWTYGDVITDFVDHWNKMYINGDLREDIVIATNYMYNDIGGGDILGCMSDTIDIMKTRHYPYERNISGVAQCMCCGNIIKYDGCSDHANTLICDECDDACEPIAYCEDCGAPIYDDEDSGYYIHTDGITYCERCVGAYFSSCEHCGNMYYTNETTSLSALTLNSVGGYSTRSTVCQDCLDNFPTIHPKNKEELLSMYHFDDEVYQNAFEAFADECDKYYFHNEESYAILAIQSSYTPTQVRYIKSTFGRTIMNLYESLGEHLIQEEE